MKLTDMIPTESKFTLKKAKREFILNPINLSDEIWLKNEYGEDGIQEIFEKINIEEISRIVFRLMRVEDKEFFASKEVTIIDESGVKETMILGGVNLLRTYISGWGEKLAILNSLLENIGASRPELKELEEDAKKKVKKTTKKKTEK